MIDKYSLTCVVQYRAGFTPTFIRRILEVKEGGKITAENLKQIETLFEEEFKARIPDVHSVVVMSWQKLGSP